MAEKLVNKEGLEEFTKKVKEKAVFIGSEGPDPTPLGIIETEDLQDGAVTTAKLGNSSVTATKISNSSVITDKIANSAVTSDKINWSTLKPRWKIVSTSNTNTVTIPSGYRMYRLTFVGYKSTTDWGVFNSSYKTGTGWAYGCGFRNGNWFSEEFTSDNNYTFITCGAGTSITSGEQLTTMTMSVNGTQVQCVYQNSYWNSGSCNSGRSCFNISSSSSNWTISSECSTNKWVVEAFDE